jgi:glutamate N-acetyltransferase/amino-acid N-acetyltransferase
MTHLKYARVMRTITRVPGFSAGSADAGLRRQPALDVALIVSDRPCTAAGVFTTNRVRAAPVLLDEARLRDTVEGYRAVLINAGCANACTGEQGMRNAAESAAWVGKALGCAPESVLVMSTGVIGTQLPMDRLQPGISAAARVLDPEGWHDASRAILTTDTQPKRARALHEGAVIAGIAKGAGMIAPNMATMLALVVTSAAVPPPLLDQALREAVAHSFNRIVVDGDMSTNDTVLVLANGASRVQVTPETLPAFTLKLTAVCVALAQAVVRDAEGATQFITLEITGAPDVASARQIGHTIATSPLVKTAFYGGDANWGRILAAAGRAGIALDPDRLALWYDDLQLVAAGAPLDYDEALANRIAGQSEVTVRLDLGLGEAAATIWTCDLSHDYVSINGHYRT